MLSHLFLSCLTSGRKVMCPYEAGYDCIVCLAFPRLWVRISIATSCSLVHFSQRSLGIIAWATELHTLRMLSAGGLPFWWERSSTYGETWGERKVDPLTFNLMIAFPSGCKSRCELTWGDGGKEMKRQILAEQIIYSVFCWTREVFKMH
jgi:hypothetical protein